MDGPAGDPFLDLLAEGEFTVRKPGTSGLDVRIVGSRGPFPFEGQGPIMEIPCARVGVVGPDLLSSPVNGTLFESIAWLPGEFGEQSATGDRISW